MRKLIFIFILAFSISANAQWGHSTSSTPSTNSVDSTKIVASNVTSTKIKDGEVLNADIAASAVTSAKIATLTADLIFSAGTLNASSTMAGSGAFTGTNTTVTITVAGGATTDLYFIALTGTAAPVATDNIRVDAQVNQFVLTRGAAGTSGLTFNWLRIKP